MLNLSTRPLTDSFALAWERDDAFDTERESFVNDYLVALETLDWAKLCKPGELPTLFHFRPLSSAQLRAIADAAGGRLATVTALAFRAALVRVENCDAMPKLVRRIESSYSAVGPLVQQEIVDLLDLHSQLAGAEWGSIVSTLGGLVVMRSKGVDIATAREAPEGGA